MNRATGMLSGVTLLLWGVGQARAEMFHYTGTIQTYTIPTTGIYDITVAGAQGGSGFSTTGGRGAVLSGDISLTAGTVLQIVVGGQGESGNAPPFGDVYGGGGGGGSFVSVPSASQLLVVSGGGGGGAYQNGSSNPNGSSGQTGTAGQNGFGTDGGVGGTAGSGGGGGTNSGGANGGGGAGWLSNGGKGIGSESGLGGFGPTTFAGGTGYNGFGDGGFGGGGGGGDNSGGGGGGYSGGGGGDGLGVAANFGLGGGGSFFDPSFTILSESAGANSGNGYVDIVPAISTPEPSSLLLLGMGGVSWAVYGWRRRKQVA